MDVGGGGAIICGLPNLRIYLRTETRSLHEDVDGAFAPLDLSRREDYVRFLQAHHAALAPLERARAAADWPSGLPAPLDAAPLVAADLADLGEEPGTAIELAPGFEPVGVTYVLAGSRMGNKLLRQQVHEATDGRPTRYVDSEPLDSFGRDYLVALKSMDAGRDAGQVLAGARCAFTMFKRASGSMNMGSQ